ncbi:MAG: aminoacyl-tRNA hydrolase [Candidatus Aminicenantes bacterium]|nr:aminoacyl-tRNA hydrolase [Candidatus Aminicenantes bacterium]
MGNPDKIYEKSPHNAGFMCIEEICRRHDIALAGLGRILHYKKARICGQDVVLAKPMTYMNESGLAVHKLQKMFSFAYSDMLVIYDDIDLPLGSIRIRERGSSGTHKGMRSVIQHCGTQDFPRLRIGIRNPVRRTADIIRYVLKPLRGQSFAKLQEGVVSAAEAAQMILENDIHGTMNIFNRRKNSLLLQKEEAKTSTRRKNE